MKETPREKMKHASALAALQTIERRLAAYPGRNPQARRAEEPKASLSRQVQHPTPAGGIFIMASLGSVGGLFTGIVWRALGWSHPGDATSLLVAVVGSVVMLAGYRLIAGRRA